jgi:hypothetical protein
MERYESWIERAKGNLELAQAKIIQYIQVENKIKETEANKKSEKQIYHDPLIQREPFDYTKWQENLFEDMTIEELAKKADEYVKNNNSLVRQPERSP